MSNIKTLNTRIPGADLVAVVTNEDTPAPSINPGDVLLIERKPTAQDGDIVIVKEIKTGNEKGCMYSTDKDRINLISGIGTVSYSPEDFKNEVCIIGRVFESRTMLDDDMKKDYGII